MHEVCPHAHTCFAHRSLLHIAKDSLLNRMSNSAFSPQACYIRVRQRHYDFRSIRQYHCVEL